MLLCKSYVLKALNRTFPSSPPLLLCIVPGCVHPFNDDTKKLAMTCKAFYRHPVHAHTEMECLILVLSFEGT